MNLAVNQHHLVDALRLIGLTPGAVVLVHSSLSRLGQVKGGAGTVVDALLEAVGQDGTVLFPTLTGTEQDGPAQPPVMDVRRTPCWTGAIPEAARQRPDAVRSWHPTHSVTALGADADRWTAGHEQSATPCDEESPYHRLIQEDGLILLLGGVTQQSNTTLHCLEELAGVPYHLQPDVTVGAVVDEAGNRHVIRNRLHQWGWARHFMKVDALLDAVRGRNMGAVGNSQSQLIRARNLAEVVLPRLEADPLFLLSDEARRVFSTR